MGLFDFLKSNVASNISSAMGKNSPNAYVDSSTISPDERPFYKPDNYYTFYSYPGTSMAVRVVPFEERKQTTYPSARGLYVAEILLLEYCNDGKYPKPSSGYPGFWWFKYGIRDVGHALESLEKRGFLRWAPKYHGLNNLKAEELKKILDQAGLDTKGKKADLIERISSEIPEDRLAIPEYVPKYELTELGKAELNDNGYVPYMHNHNHLTTEDGKFGETFTVWDINKYFPDGNAKEWRHTVGIIEKKRFGVDMANATPAEKPDKKEKEKDCSDQRDEMRAYLAQHQGEISRGIQSGSDGFKEESQGLDYKATGRDKEALVKLYVAIGKRFDAPALYRETAKLLRKYAMYEEELSVLNVALDEIKVEGRHKEELSKRREKVLALISKNS
ncbi:hypothetical protein D6855_14275 [Butyrivibrio sp. CB08]|uniref:SAP domain-containing protein n=1 Tax=Butyrivibrio sp. CB08 TaxID=2364879 RepID=UPI000EA89A00|nr:SAP domain-containing protein [Butyrivibrio sp. CB08]RKM56831.1 hypothetical protein D6855_14275 [Butyrivibrio sp. CB08]